MLAKYEWDKEKDAQNFQKHGISFKEASLIFEGPVFTRVDDRNDYGEIRELSFGMLGGGIVILAVAHTERNGKTRLISARKATPKERKIYYGYLAEALG